MCVCVSVSVCMRVKSVRGCVTYMRVWLCVHELLSCANTRTRTHPWKKGGRINAFPGFFDFFLFHVFSIFVFLSFENFRTCSPIIDQPSFLPLFYRSESVSSPPPRSLFLSTTTLPFSHILSHSYLTVVSFIA